MIYTILKQNFEDGKIIIDGVKYSLQELALMF